MAFVMVAASVTACSVGEGFAGGAANIARTEHLALHRDTLADIALSGKNVPVNRELVERWVFRWVEFALFAERVARGDSMLDSATVVRAMWTDANQWLVDEYHEKLAAERVDVNAATVDSAFAAGDHRLIHHILIRTTPDMSPPQRTAALQKAEGIRARLVAGSSWEDENDANEDPVARRAGGSLGVIERNQMVVPFEETAYGLAPGELSEVVETQYGYHVIRRPVLDDVREVFADEITDILTVRMDSTVLQEIAGRWKVRVRANAPSLMREAAAAPLRVYQSPRVLGSHRGGDFTTADLMRWLQAMPGMVFQNVPSASDEQLADLLHSLIRNEALVREASEEGMTIPADSLEVLEDRLREEIALVRTVVGLDSAMAGLMDQDARLAACESAIRDYFRGVAASSVRSVVVPAFLAHQLRETMEWHIAQPAVDETLERIVRLRQERLEPAGVPPLVPPADADSTSTDSAGGGRDAP
jgi:hypothetical protein